MLGTNVGLEGLVGVLGVSGLDLLLFCLQRRTQGPFPMSPDRVGSLRLPKLPAAPLCTSMEETGLLPCLLLHKAPRAPTLQMPRGAVCTPPTHAGSYTSPTGTAILLGPSSSSPAAPFLLWGYHDSLQCPLGPSIARGFTLMVAMQHRWETEAWRD